MGTDSKKAAYAAMVAEAEAAVGAVKDPELRRVAFEKILTTLIEAGSPRSGPLRGRRKVQQSTGGTAGGIEPPGRKARRGPKGYVEELIKDDFFKKKQRTIAEVKAELANRGHHIAITSLSGPLQSLTQDHKLRREPVAKSKGKKPTYAYSNW